MSSSKAVNGFTIIELVIVMLILVTLSVTAAPKFLDLGKSAKVAILDSTVGAVRSLTYLIGAKAKLSSIEDGSVQINDSNTGRVRGFEPIAHWNQNFRYILDLPGAPFGFTQITSRCSKQVCGVGNQTNWPANNGTLNSQIANLNGNRRAVFIWLDGYMLSDECYVYFVEKELNNPNSNTITGKIDSGC